MNRAVAAAPVLNVEPRGEAHARVAEFVARFTGRHWRRGLGEIAHALPARFASRMRRQPDFNRQAWADGECRSRTMGDIDAWLSYRQIQRLEKNIEQRRANAARWSDLLQSARLPCRLPPAGANVFTVLPLLFEGTDAARTAGFVRQSLERGGDRNRALLYAAPSAHRSQRLQAHRHGRVRIALAACICRAGAAQSVGQGLGPNQIGGRSTLLHL